MRPRNSLISLVLTCLGALCVTPAAWAANYFVAPCGQDFWAGVSPNCVAPLGPKRTVQAAINAASNGDTIFVLPGTYIGQIDMDGKAVHLVSTGGPNATFLDGNGSQRVVLCNSLEGPNTVIEGFTIRNGSTGGDGGGMLIALASPTVVNCIFLNNEAFRGGAVATVGASPDFTGCVFNSNDASDGGAIYGQGGVIDLDDCTFIGNDGGNRGGAIFLVSNSQANITDSLFSANVVTSGKGSGGGAIATNDSSVMASNTTFQFNHSAIGGGFGGSGGAIMLWGDESTGMFTGCEFLENAAEGGGALDISQADASFVGCEFRENEANRGGAISATVLATVNLTLCGFFDNQVSGGIGENIGGAIRANSSTLNISGSVFTGNSAEVGGAILSQLGAMTISGSQFQNNESDTDGGAAWISGDAMVSGSNFSGNMASEFGGAIAFYGNAEAGILNDLPAGLTINNVTFESNEAYWGAGLSGSGDVINVKDSVFSQNHAEYRAGGASLPNVYHVTSIENCQFYSNTAGSYGGGLSILGVANISGSLFSANTSATGGAVIASSFSHPQFLGCRFEGNTATMRGGAMATQAGGAPVLMNCLVVGNLAPNGTGTLSEQQNLPSDWSYTIVNSVVANNSGGGYIVDNAGTVGRVSNSIFWGNSSGPQIGGAFAPMVRRSIVQGGMVGFGNMSSNPMFVNAAVGNFRLQPGSPGIDAGDNSLVPVDQFDIDEDGNATERFPIDFEGNPRFANNPGAADVGCGSVATVDIGAFETAGDAMEDVIVADLNGDGVVNGADLAALLSQWGTCAACCTADFDHDGFVDGFDLATLLESWG